MKNIFIGGVAKSGKSRLATYYCKDNKLNHLPLDYLASSFKHVFPEVGITSNVVIDKRSSELFSEFLSRFIEIVESKDDEFFILDSAHILPEDIIKYLNPDKWEIIYLGYPDMTAEAKIEEINKYSHGGWTSKRSKDELIEIFNELIKMSLSIEESCKKNGIRFINTSNKDVLDLI